jgi:hypothetical protein
MSDRKVERTVKIFIEFDLSEVRELASFFAWDSCSDMSRRYRDIFESALDE